MARSSRFAARPFEFSRLSGHRKKSARLSPRRKHQRLNLESLENRWLLAANVVTDLVDYAPGATAHIVASDFAVGETVEFQVLHTDGVPNTGGGHAPWQVTDGLMGDFDGDGTIDGDLDGAADGNIHTTWYVDPDDSANSAFELTATGRSSGHTARHAFTDTVTVTAATGGTGLTDLNYHTLGNIVINEGNDNDIPGVNNSSRTLVLTAPTGWEFNPGVGSAAITSFENDFTGGVTITVANSTISVRLIGDTSATSEDDTLTISGIQVKATSASSAQGNITRTVAEPGTLGNISGVTNGTTNFGTLSLAGVLVTPAPNGQNISNLGFNAIGDIVFQETVANGLSGANNQTRTLILNRPNTDWEFDTTPGLITVGLSANSDFSSATVTSLTISSITITFSFDGAHTDELDTVTISGIRVKADDIFSDAGNITRSSSGTLGMSGIISSTNFGSLSLVEGVLVAPAPNGDGLSSVNYLPIGNIVLNENVNDGFTGSANTTYNFVLSAPAGWEFNPGVGSVSVGGGGDFSGGPPSIEVANSTISVNVRFDFFPTSELDTITISGIEARATSASSTAGNITRSRSTFSMAPVNSATNFGTLSLPISAGVISGKKFQDNNGDGIENGTDAGLLGWTIQLDKDANGTVDATTVTGAGGAYSFTGLTAGSYRIREVGQVGWIQTTVNPADVSVVSGTNSTGNNFGNFQLGAISGMKFQDTDGDGVKDAGEPGLLGWTIQLDKDANGTVDATTMTDASGNYSFTGLTAGVYRIREVGQVSWIQTTVNPADVNVVSGTNSMGNNFGNFQLGAISGMKFQDTDGDGVKDAGEPGLLGWTIQLDKDANGTVDATTMTDASGNYSFTGLTAGVHRIREVGQVGWIQTTVNPADVSVVSGTNSTGNNFGNFKLGAISGMKFQDNNGDGIENGTDAGLLGWTIQLDKDANGTVDATTVTGAGGAYSFTGLTAGSYRIREVGQVGWIQTTVNPADVNVVSGTNSTGNNFGNFKYSYIIIGPDKGNGSVPIIKVINKDTGKIVSQFYAYEGKFLGGVQVATGDLTGDGIDEIITAPGQGRVGEVRVFTQQGVELTQFRVQPYGYKYMGGIEVAVGDVNCDGRSDIVTATKYGRPDIRVFYNNYNTAYPTADAIADAPSKQFYAFDSKFNGGADVVVADMGTFYNGATYNAYVPDGKSEIIVGNGPGMRSTVNVYDVTTSPKIIDTILPLSSSFKGGITLSTARVNGDAIPDIIVAAGNGGGSIVETWNGLVNDALDARLSAFSAFGDLASRNMPVHATALDTTGDGIADLLAVVQGTNGTSNQIRFFKPNGTLHAVHYGFTGPWNIDSLKNVDPSLPLNTLADMAAKDDVYTEIGTESTPPKATKAVKKAAKKKN